MPTAAFLPCTPLLATHPSPRLGLRARRVRPRKLFLPILLPHAPARASIAANPIPAQPASPLSTTPPPPPPPRPVVQRPVPRFLRLLLQTSNIILPALLAALIASLCSVLQPLFFGNIIAILANAGAYPPAVARRLIFLRTARLVCIYCLEVTATVAYVRLVARAVDATTRRLRERVFATTLRNDLGFFDAEGNANVVRTISDEINVVRNSVWNNLSRDRGLRAILEIVLGVLLAIKVTGTVGTPIFGFMVPIVSSIVAQLGLRNGRIASRMAEKDADVRLFLDEKMRGVRTLKAFGAERRERGTLAKLLNIAEVSANQLGLSKAMTEAASRISIYFTISVFFIMGGMLICSGALSFEMFSCLTGFIWILNFAMQGISYSIADASKVATSLTKIFSLLDNAHEYTTKRVRPSSIVEGKPFIARGEIQFNNVYFQYPSRPDLMVLNDISFSIRPGQMIALVGDSGGGKSTVAAILSRFYQPTSGSVTVDGKDIHTIPTEIYARQISVVDQDPVLFKGTIRENIAYGMPDDDVDDEAVVRAATEANAHGFISALPDGYETIWTPASSFSGGQRQRIAIARSLIKSPPILVLDEATSALDQESERMVQSALEQVMKGRSVLIIAHRLSTVRSADAILFVKHGRIVERGTYDELIAKPNGNFRALVESAADVVETSPII